jgi:hypothetical protein
MWSLRFNAGKMVKSTNPPDGGLRSIDPGGSPGRIWSLIPTTPEGVECTVGAAFL